MEKIPESDIVDIENESNIINIDDKLLIVFEENGEDNDYLCLVVDFVVIMMCSIKESDKKYDLIENDYILKDKNNIK